jgi:hypothetical protein
MLFAHLKRILKLDWLRLRGPCGAKDAAVSTPGLTGGRGQCGSRNTRLSAGNGEFVNTIDPGADILLSSAFVQSPSPPLSAQSAPLSCNSALWTH